MKKGRVTAYNVSNPTAPKKREKKKQLPSELNKHLISLPVSNKLLLDLCEVLAAVATAELQ